MEVPELRAKWEHLHHNLQTSSHNYLRITRMMKYLELFPLHELQLNILSCFLRQIYCHEQAIAWVRTTVPFAKPNLGIVHTLLQWEAEASVHVPGYLPSLSLHQYMDTTPERLAQLLNPSLGSDLACGLCTFINVKSATKCEMCDSTSRG